MRISRIFFAFALEELEKTVMVMEVLMAKSFCVDGDFVGGGFGKALGRGSVLIFGRFFPLFFSFLFLSSLLSSFFCQSENKKGFFANTFSFSRFLFFK